MVPTTLLAQVDSSVGGKVGVNHPRAKNIIGAFHQPVGVWIDTDDACDTLPARELRCGLAEVVKYGVILDADFFAELEANAEAILGREPDGAAADRRPELPAQGRGRRRRTSARRPACGPCSTSATRSATRSRRSPATAGAFQHGEAVAVGMVAEARLAERLGWIGPEVTARLIAPARAVRPADRRPGPRPRRA